MQYLVELDSDHKAFEKLRRFFKKHGSKENLYESFFAGCVKENDGQDMYVVCDDEDSYPEAKVIDMTEWEEMFPQEGQLTALPEFYLVEMDPDSPHYKEFRHFSVDQSDEDINLSDYTHAGMTSEGWLSTDEPSDFDECFVLTMNEWKAVRSPNYEIC